MQYFYFIFLLYAYNNNVKDGMRKGIRYIFYTKLSHDNYTKFNIKKCKRPSLEKKNQRLIKNQS